MGNGGHWGIGGGRLADYGRRADLDEGADAAADLSIRGCLKGSVVKKKRDLGDNAHSADAGRQRQLPGAPRHGPRPFLDLIQ